MPDRRDITVETVGNFLDTARVSDAAQLSECSFPDASVRI